jgi:hypothetical protein
MVVPVSTSGGPTSALGRQLSAAAALLVACYCCYSYLNISPRPTTEQLSVQLAAPYEAPSAQYQERPGELGNRPLHGSSMQRSCLCWEGRCVCEHLVNFASRPLEAADSHPAASIPAAGSSLPGLDVDKSTTFHLMGAGQTAQSPSSKLRRVHLQVQSRLRCASWTTKTFMVSTLNAGSGFLRLWRDSLLRRLRIARLGEIR